MSSTEITKLETRWRENPHGLTFAPLAEAYRKQREPERALEVLADGLARHPDYIPASIVLGRCHLDLADDTRAEAAFLRVLELDDENVIALKALADILERQGRPGDAASRLRSLLAVDRSNDEARAQLSRVEAMAREAPPAPARRDDEAVAATAHEHLSPDDFVWDEPAPSSGEAAAHADLLLEDNLRPTGEVEQLPDIVIDEPPAIHGEAAAAMPGLVGEDFPEHRAGVVPLPDLAPGTAALGEHTAFGHDDHDEELLLAHAASSEEGPPGADEEPPAGDVMVEPVDELERSAEIELTPSGDSDFQIQSVSDDWAAGRLAGGGAGDFGDSLERAESAFDGDEAAADVSFAGMRAAGDELAESDQVPVESFAEEPGPVGEEHTAAGSDVDSMPEPDAAAFAEASQYDDSADEDYDSDEEPTSPPLPDDLVVTESMAELFLRQGHRAEALLVYRELYHRNRDDLRLREKVDSLETALAAEEAASPRGRSYAARERGRSVASFLSGILGARPADAASAWIVAPAPPAPAPAAIEAVSESGDAAPTRPASDHLSLSDVFGDTGSPVPPAVAATAGAPSADDGVSFDSFFGEATGAALRPRGGTRDDDDLDQFHAWLQNLKR